MSNSRIYILDAMRGLAAIAVLVMHVGNVMHIPTIPHAYLAVDFFFMLSGFVLGRTYEGRLRAGLPPRDFALMRLIRLYPVFLLGILLGIFTIIGQMAGHSAHALSPSKAVAAFMLNILMLPINVPESLFPYDPPAWSLFFELMISIVFGTVLFRIRTPALMAIVGMGGVLFLFGIAHLGTADFGWAWDTFLFGTLRVGFSFPLGMIFARLLQAKRRVVSTAVSSVLIGALWAIFGIDLSIEKTWLYDAVAIFVAMPAILWLGAITELPDRLKVFGAILGDASYPLYAIHYPLLQILFYIFARRLHLPPFPVAVLFSIGSFSISLAIARFYDAPVRQWLGRVLIHQPESKLLVSVSAIDAPL